MLSLAVPLRNGVRCGPTEQTRHGPSEGRNRWRLSPRGLCYSSEWRSAFRSRTPGERRWTAELIRDEMPRHRSCSKMANEIGEERVQPMSCVWQRMRGMSAHWEKSGALIAAGQRVVCPNAWTRRSQDQEP